MTSDPECFSATKDLWTEIEKAAAAILYVRVRFDNDDLAMAKEAITESRRLAMKILDLIPPGATHRPVPGK